MFIFDKIRHWYLSRNALPYWYVLALDCIIVLTSGYIGSYLEIGGYEFAVNFWPITLAIFFSIGLFVIAFRLFHTYTGVIRYSSFVDLQRSAVACFVGSVLSYLYAVPVVRWATGFCYWTEVAHVIVMMFIVSTLTIWLVRVAVKSMFDNFRIDSYTRKAFIYGIKQGGIALAKSIQSQMPRAYSLAGFVSPHGDIRSDYMMGVRIYRANHDLIRNMKREGADVLLVSPLCSEQFREDEMLVNALTSNGIRIMMMPNATEWDGKSALSHQQLHEVDIEDLLPREKIDVDMDAIANKLSGSRILITGAAGSIGSEIVRQVAQCHPAEMVLIDQAETPMHDIRLLMMRKFADIPCETIVTSITNQAHMERIFSAHRPEYVFHAAAYKHVPMMEDNPAIAVQNNIYGTRVIADLAVKYGTHKFVMVSTDKAVNPTNVMGCSKRICEIYCQALNAALLTSSERNTPPFPSIHGGSCVTPPFPSIHGGSCVSSNGTPTQFVTTRFGNVLGSNGSVIPIFKEQIAKGGPITVTHPDIIRYFMLIPEACKLVLEAGTMGHGGEIFVFDMGKPVRIVDLAKRMIALSGAKNIEIKFTGLRDGEKLYEDVLNDAEHTKPTVHPKIKVASVREYDYATACANEERLLEASRHFDDMEIVRIMKEIVPEFKSNHSKYEVLDKEKKETL